MTNAKNKKLIDKLTNFAEGNSRHAITTTTISEIRQFYKPKEDVPTSSKILYHIFNSVWNRVPNFVITSVLEDKLRYAIKIGSGISSYNQLPISWIEDNTFNFKNFLMKDRGHITTLICWLYSSKFPLTSFEKIVNKLITEYKAVDGWKHDYSISHTVSILEKVYSYIEENKNQQKKNGVKKAEQTISIQNICENVPSFGDTLNNFEVSIEIRRESIHAHMSEILSLNNTFNKWIEYQKAFLSFVGKVMRLDGDDNYIRNTFNIDAVRNHIDDLKTFTGNSNSPLFSSAIASYNRKVSEYSEIIPMRFLGLRKLTSFDKRGPYYYSSTEKSIEEQLSAIRSSNLNESDAKLELTMMDRIASHSAWSEYEEKRKSLLKAQPDKVNTKNLEDASLGKEDFGMACVDTVMELRSSLPHMGDRTSEKQIDLLVTAFVNSLIVQMEKVVEDESLFNVGATMENRFQKLIFPAYITAKDSFTSGDPKHNQQLIYETLLHNELMPLVKLHGQTKFRLINFTRESYNAPKVIEVDFNESRRSHSGFDLGQRKQGMGYTIENCIIQPSGHNRSQNNDDHDMSNIGYWKWYSKTNLEEVNKHREHFLNNDDINVIADAGKLNKIFNGNN